MNAPAQTSNGSILTADELLTADEVAEIFKLPKSTIEDYARRCLVPSIRLGRHRRFVRSQLEAWVHDQLEGDDG